MAIHKGPYNAVSALESGFEKDQIVYLVDSMISKEQKGSSTIHIDSVRVKSEWGDLESFVSEINPSAVIRGCSEGVRSELNIESQVAQICLDQDIPVFVIEDFPGNYWPGRNERLDGIFVEDDSLGKMYEARGIRADLIHVIRNPRYDAWKAIDFNSAREGMRDKLGISDSRTILWAGQPDGNNSYETLKRVLESYRNEDVNLLFRAHPRDSWYINGDYSELMELDGVNIIDVTNDQDLVGLYCAADLVATQFSSAAVEASHLGVPAVYILFEDLGQRNLKESKGYSIPLWARHGSSFIIRNQEELSSTIDEALFNLPRRNQVLANFNSRFSSSVNHSDCIINRIKASIESIEMR